MSVTRVATEPILYYSTNRNVRGVNLREALLQGQAADRGLFMPERIPQLTTQDLLTLADKSYPEIAEAVLSRFTAGMIGDTRLRAACHDAYDFEVPLQRIEGRRFVMRLDCGPTASFKDFAARMMARWTGALVDDNEDDLVILTATSGDTGSAVAHAYHGVPHVFSVVLFPIAEISDRQRRQMTTLGGNVAAFGVEGKFDDCQAMVKQAFSDPQLARLRMSSANSINVGRLLPQAVYYVYAYVRLADVAAMEPIVFSVPSGNFGDMMGGVLARKMGLPISTLVVATNANDEVPRFFATGRYEKIAPSRACISNAMNVGHPSNLARLVDVYGGRMDEIGAILENPDMEALRRDCFAISISDDETRATIRSAWECYGALLEPHGAVAWAGLLRYLAAADDQEDRLAVSIETAHPAKFPDEIRSVLGIEPPVPASLAAIETKAENFGRLSTDYEPFRHMLNERFPRG